MELLFFWECDSELTNQVPDKMPNFLLGNVQGAPE